MFLNKLNTQTLEVVYTSVEALVNIPNEGPSI